MRSRAGVAARALIAQLAAAAIVLGAILSRQGDLPGWAATAWGVAGLQGLLAAMIGLLLGAAWWWFPIHLLFFPAILLLQQLHLSPAVHLAVFLCLLVFNWGVIRTRVPLYLSRPAVWKEVEALLPAGQSYRLLDIGSGLGGMLLHLDQARPLGRHEGIEISPAPWFISRVRARLAGTRASFKCGDYRALDLSGYDVVFAFLSPLVMEALQHKASREMRPGTLLVSLAFPLPGVEHDLVIRTGSASRQALYVWRVRPVSPAPQAQTLSPTPRHQPA